MNLPYPYFMMEEQELDENLCYYTIKNKRTRKAYSIRVEKEEKRILVESGWQQPSSYRSRYYHECKEVNQIIPLIKEAIEEHAKYRLYLVTGDTKVEIEEKKVPSLPTPYATYHDVYQWNKREKDLIISWLVVSSVWFLFGMWNGLHHFWIDNLFSGIISLCTTVSFVLCLIFSSWAIVQRIQLMIVSYRDWEKIDKEWNT